MIKIFQVSWTGFDCGHKGFPEFNTRVSNILDFMIKNNIIKSAIMFQPGEVSNDTLLMNS